MFKGLRDHGQTKKLGRAVPRRDAAQKKTATPFQAPPLLLVINEV
jgi:hypothetical protein